MSKYIQRHNDLIVTEVRSKEFVCTWKIVNFKLLHLGSGKFVASENSEQKHWRLNLYPDGYDYTTKEYLSVNISFIKTSIEIKHPPYAFFLYIIDVNGKEREIHKITNGGINVFVPKLINRNYLLDEKNELLLNGNLILKFKIQFTSEVISKSKSAAVISSVNAPNLNGLENILNNKKFSDVKIIVGRKVFYAYKGILANQSPVFAAMFEHDMKENKENSVRITDINHEIMQEMLFYMYNGSVNKIEVIARDLLAAADKYEIEPLKMMCEKSLINDLNVNTVISLLLFAEKYGSKTLRESALEFFTLNAKEIIQTEQYQADLDNLLPFLPDIIRSLL